MYPGKKQAAASDHRNWTDGIYIGLQVSAIALALSLSAVLLTLGIGSGSYPWLTWLCPLPLFLAIRVMSRTGAAVCGAVWGICLFLFCLTGAAHLVPPSLLSLFLLIAVPAVYAGLGVVLTRAIGFNPLLLGLGWVLVEIALKPAGFNQGLLTGTQGDYSLVHQISSLLGYVFVAFLVAWANASLLQVLSNVRICIPRLGARIGLPEPAGCLRPHTFLQIPLLSLAQGTPRAPPLPCA